MPAFAILTLFLPSIAYRYGDMSPVNRRTAARVLWHERFGHW